MATFPKNVFTSGADAQSALVGTASDLGFTLGVGFDANDAMAALTQNMAWDKSQTMSPAAGATGGTGAIVKSSVVTKGGIITTKYLIDFTGWAAAAAGDIIGKAAAAPVSYIGRVTAAINGTIKGGMLYCYETPAGGDADIDLYASLDATGAYDVAISGLSATKVVDGVTLATGDALPCVADSIAADSYLYFVSVGATAAAYTAGRVYIELYGV